MVQRLFLRNVRADAALGLPDGTHGARHRTRLRGMQQQMYMVVHQHIGVDEDIVACAGRAQEVPVMMPILIVQEDRVSVHPSLGDMHGNAGHFDPGLAGHRADPGELPAVFAHAPLAGIGEMPVRG